MNVTISSIHAYCMLILRHKMLVTVHARHNLSKASLKSILHKTRRVLWATQQRTFRQNSARQEEVSMKEAETLLETKLSREFLGSASSNFVPDTSIDQHKASPKNSQGNAESSSIKNLLAPTWISWIFLLYMYFALFLVRPKLDLLSGVPWWSVSPDTISIWLLFNLTLSSAERKQLKEKYEALKAKEDRSFVDFLDENDPDIFTGVEFSQREIIAALGACYAFAGTRDFIQQLQKVAQGSHARRMKIDDIMHYLRKAYPQVFSV